MIGKLFEAITKAKDKKLSIESKITEQNNQLKDRESQDFLLMNPQEIMTRMQNLQKTLALPSQSNCKYLPQSLG